MSRANSNAHAAFWLGLALLPAFCSAFSVCVLSDSAAGYAACTPGGSSKSATGYDVDIFRRAAADMGWTEVEGSTAPISMSTAAGPNSSYAFVCQPSTTNRRSLMQAMALNNVSVNTCTVVIGHVMQNGTLGFLGGKFSQPWLQTSIAVVVDSYNEIVLDKWAWTKPFAGSVWASLACNLLLVAICLWLIERFQAPGAKVKMNLEDVADLKLKSYRTILAMFSQDIMPVNTTTAQVVVVAYLFHILILLATYTANLTANLTLGNSVETITEIRQLQTMKVLASAEVVSTINILFQINATGIDLSTDAAWMTVQNSLISKQYDAFVGYMTDIDYYKNRLDVACRITYAADAAGYFPNNMGAMFHTAVPAALVRAFGASIFRQRENSQLYRLQANLLLMGNTTCPAVDPTATTSTAVKFEQLLGLWIILAAGVGVAIIQAGWMVIQYTRSTIREAKVTGDHSMTVTRAISAMIVKDAPDDEEELPPELRTHKIKSALQHILMKRSNSEAGGGVSGRMSAAGSMRGRNSQNGGNQSTTPFTPNRNAAGENSNPDEMKKKAGAIPPVSVDSPGPVSGLIPSAPQRSVETVVQDFQAPITTGAAPPKLDNKDNEVVEL